MTDINDVSEGTSAPVREQFTIEDLIQATVRAMVIHEQAVSPRRDKVTDTTSEPICQPQKRSFTNSEIAALLPEFTGTRQDIELWLEQITAIQNVYKVPDDIMQIIAVGKLTSRARQWFQSKVEYITMDWPSLKTEMRRMYSSRSNVVMLRKQFEKRRWRPNECFASYYHDKVMLGNSASVPEHELIQYIIDGFDNKTLQTQARMMMYDIRCLEDLFNIMNNVVQEETSTVKSSAAGSNARAVRSGISSTWNTVKCYNCNMEGHKVNQCTKPLRQKGSCFHCGSMAHRIKECPERKSKFNLDSTTNVIQSPHVIL